MKTLLAVAIISILGFMGSSCGGDIPDCPTQLCVFAGGWRLVEVRIDGVKDTSTDLSKYKLTLFMPNSTASDTSNYDRINPSGTQDIGDWYLENNDKGLTLRPESSPIEKYNVKSISPRQMILIIDREVRKTGPEEYEFILEPF